MYPEHYHSHFKGWMGQGLYKPSFWVLKPMVVKPKMRDFEVLDDGYFRFHDAP